MGLEWKREGLVVLYESTTTETVKPRVSFLTPHSKGQLVVTYISYSLFIWNDKIR